MALSKCKGVIPDTFIVCGECDGDLRQFCSDECLRASKIPDGRFVIRPDIDPNDDKAVKKLAEDIAGWVVEQRKKMAP